MTDSIELANGMFLFGTDLEGLNEFLVTPDARQPGVAVLLMGELNPGQIDAAVVQGEPIGKAIKDTANGTLKRAAVVRMTTYYDERHCVYLQRGIVRAVAAARGMTPKDDVAAETISGETGVPMGDLPALEQALAALVARIDVVIGYPLIGNAGSSLN